MSSANSSLNNTEVNTYRGFQLVENQGWHFGIRPDLAHIDPTDPEAIRQHPAVVSGPTVEILKGHIDAFDPTPFTTEEVGDFENHRLVRHRNRIYGIPNELGTIDLNWDDDRTLNGIVWGETREVVEARIRHDRTAAPVEFLGWLPVFKRFGNCGKHPQFGHTAHPPTGYKFVRTRVKPTSNRPPQPGKIKRLLRTATTPFRLAVQAGPAMIRMVGNVREFGVRRCAATLTACFTLFMYLVRKTGRVIPTLRFIHTRHLRSQLMVPHDAELAFLTSIPHTFNQTPWTIEIEDAMTLFYPFLHNGMTANVDVRQSPYFAVVKALLESEKCRGILTHMQSTAETLPTLFQSEVVARKVSYAPLGVDLPKRWQQHEDTDGPIHLLFTNSWHQEGVGFLTRGGLDVLAAFDVLHERYPQLRLTIRSAIPAMGHSYYKVIKERWVRIIDRFLPADELDELQRGSHIYLLPSARIHIVSVLQAMSYGQVVVASDGWGMEEYVTHEQNGLIVKGRAGKVSWMDHTTGVLREDYRHMHAPDPVVVDGIIQAVSRLVENPSLRRQIGHQARKAVETRYTMDRWNAALKEFFDQARQSGAF